jgi:hypothetical protein
MMTAAKRALRWKEEGKAKGAGTPIGWGRATDIVNGSTMSLSTVKRMYSFFSRHEVDKKGKDFDNTSDPSNGRIMWDAWGGDAGFTWSKTIVEREKKKLEKHMEGKHDQSTHGKKGIHQPQEAQDRIWSGTEAENEFKQTGNIEALKKKNAKATVQGMLGRGVTKERLDAYAASKGFTGKDAAEQAVGNLVDKWNLGSATDEMRSVQEVAKKTFDLKGSSDAPKGLPENAENEDIYKAFLETQYDATQKFFADKGITEVTLWRGVQRQGAGNSLKDINLVSGQRASVDVKTRPLSSFTTSPAIAEKFASGGTDVIFKTVVPVSRIFSTPITGLGTYFEREMVLLGGTDPSIAFPFEPNSDYREVFGGGTPNA